MAESVEAPLPKYPAPKILLVDLKDNTADLLRSQGYNISVGSYGTPYRVTKSDVLFPVIVNGSLPGLPEQDIVIIDLAANEPLSGATGSKQTTPGESDWWAKCNAGTIDPRPRLMDFSKAMLDRILAHGGVVVVFADPRQQQQQYLGHSEHIWVLERDLSYADNWGFSSLVNPMVLSVEDDWGREILLPNTNSPLINLLRSHIPNAYFSCAFQVQKAAVGWVTLATNKFNMPVAGILAANKGGEQGTGLVFLFPQLADKAHFLEGLLKTVLPDFSPRLFPWVEGARWVERPEYELPKIRELKSQIRQIQEEANRQVLQLEGVIEEERVSSGYLHTLLTETGSNLVEAVKKALEQLGFRSVVDVDKELAQSDDTSPKREDLQILDTSPSLLVEVKGINNLPKEASSLQSWKYVAPRMKEWKRTDIQGLSIINHQRNLPGLERENQATFQGDVIINAEQQNIGLMTTWDLFRLVRSSQKYNWKQETVKPLFYKVGRIEPVPLHYEYVGYVEHFWEKANAVGARVEAATIGIGDIVAFELPVEFEEQKVGSLQVDNKPVTEVIAGQLGGLQTALSKDQLKKGIRVFRVRR
jgi:hypothetical protein